MKNQANGEYSFSKLCKHFRIKRTKVIKAIVLTAVVMLVCTGFLSASAKSPAIVSPWAMEVVEAANLAGILPAEMFPTDYKADITRHQIAVLVANAYDRITGTTGSENDPGFADIDEYAEKRIKSLGIMNGKGGDLFKPYDNLTRQEMAKIIVSLKSVIDGEQIPESYENPPLSDFESVAQWAKPFVAASFANGIFKGRSDGAFHPVDNLTIEEAIAVVMRINRLPAVAKPVIKSEFLSEGAIHTDAEIITVSVENAKGGFELFNCCKTETGTYVTTLGNTTSSSMTIHTASFMGNGTHYLFARCADGVFSDPVEMVPYSANAGLRTSIYNPDEYTNQVTVNWNRVAMADSYTLTISETRYTAGIGDIGYGPTKVYEFDDETSFTFEAYPNITYTIELMAGNFFETCTLAVDFVTDKDIASAIKASYPTTKAEAQALMKSVTVPVWKIRDGKKVASQLTVDVHNLIADKVEAAFNDIFNGPEKAPIYTIGGFAWRGGRSEHNVGTALDLNPDENYCLYSSGAIVGSYWKPDEDEYSFSPYGDVVKCFEKYGFTWGGDAWFNGVYGTRDYMHFSYMGT